MQTKLLTLAFGFGILSQTTAYYLQRAVDTPADGSCSSTSWLTLGLGLSIQPIVTDDKGTGRVDLWRALPPTTLAGTTFDIHFQVVDADNVSRCINK